MVVSLALPRSEHAAQASPLPKQNVTGSSPVSRSTPRAHGDAANRENVDSAAMMTNDRLRRFFDAWNDHDVESIVDFFTADGAYFASIGPDDEGTAFRGTAELRRGVAAFLADYGDVRYADLSVGVLGDRGYATWTFHGVDPERGPITYRGVDVFEFEGDLIAIKDAYRKERSRPIGG